MNISISVLLKLKEGVDELPSIILSFQGRIVALNSQFFLKNGGNFVISIKANCIDSTAEPEAVFAGEVKKMQAEKMKPQEQVADQILEFNLTSHNWKLL